MTRRVEPRTSPLVWVGILLVIGLWTLVVLRAFDIALATWWGYR